MGDREKENELNFDNFYCIFVQGSDFLVVHKSTYFLYFYSLRQYLLVSGYRTSISVEPCSD
jgi:hypothetical protein